MDKEQIIQMMIDRDSRGRGSFAFFIETVRHKPRLQKLIDDVLEIDIDALPERKWIREHLHALKHELTCRPEGALTPEEIARIMIEASKPKDAS